MIGRTLLRAYLVRRSSIGQLVWHHPRRRILGRIIRRDWRRPPSPLPLRDRSRLLLRAAPTPPNGTDRHRPRSAGVSASFLLVTSRTTKGDSGKPVFCEGSKYICVMWTPMISYFLERKSIMLISKNVTQVLNSSLRLTRDWNCGNKVASSVFSTLAFRSRFRTHIH